MKKILLLSLPLFLAMVSSSFISSLYAGPVSSFENSGISLTGVSNSSLAWGDYDNDGDLDLALCGWSGSAGITKIYRNDNGTFTDIGAGITNVYNGSLAWGDYDNDGDLDLAICGYVHDDEYTARIYRNNGDDTFTDIEAGPTGVILSSLAWGDYDNDGDLDLALSGKDINSVNITKIYRNNGDNTFTDITTGLTGVESCSLAWGDYDNDGDLDLAVCGWSGSANLTKIYRNNGDDTFTDIAAGLAGVSGGSLAWGDYDNDGDLDLAIFGGTGSELITKIYRNDNGTFTDIAANLTGVCYGSLAWGDYDNDGDLDLAVCGETDSEYLTKVYQNNGDDTFTDIAAGLAGAYSGSLAWGDYDNDGDLDLAVCGYTGAYTTTIYKNLEADSNTAPSPPTNLAYESGSAILTWNPGSDSETPVDGLYYNLRLGTTPGGNDIVSGVYGSPLLGNYLRPKLSLSQLGVILGDLPEGTYYWSVQTIDTGLMKSAWSEEASFEVSGGGGSSGGSLPVGPMAAGLSGILAWWKRRKQ